MTQIRIFKGTEERNLVDKVSQCMDAIFNETNLNDQKINGVYTIPARPLDEIMQSMNSETNYLCDEVFEGEHKIPQIYQWREWGSRADQMISALDALGLQINEKERVIDCTIKT